MSEIDLQEYLKGIIEPEYIVRDGTAVYIKFRTPHLNQDLMNDIQIRLMPLGMNATIANLSSYSEGDISGDLVVIRITGDISDNLIRPLEPSRAVRPARWPWLSHPSVNIILFILTVIVVFITGAATIINRTISDDWSWSTGFQFTFALLGILTAHEFGHYFAAKYHKMDVSLPYYIPGILIPPIPWLGFPGTTMFTGTFGAFIRLRSPISNKRQLMDVGAAGPIAGFIMCLFVLVLGFVTIPELSYVDNIYDVREAVGKNTLFFGNSVLFHALSQLAGDRMPLMCDIIHYPLIFAGWLGLLVTALNLLPIGQLDGGHITYAMMGPKQKYVAYVAFASIIGLGLWFGSSNWFLWAMLILILIKLKHPPVTDEKEPLDVSRMIVGIISIIIFILCFTPTPVFEKIYEL